LAALEETAFTDCESVNDVFATFRARCTEVGVRLLSVIAPLPFRSVTAPGTYIQFWGYDPEWQAEYQEQGWDVTGRIEDQILEFGAPILWRDLEAKIQLSEPNRRILSKFFDYHGRDGICVPLFGHYAFQTLLSFAFKDRLDSVDHPRIAVVVRLAIAAQRRFIDLSRRDHQPALPLSMREQEVIQQMACGHSNKVAARKLGVSPSSIDTYQRRIFTKLEVHDRTEAVVRCLALGLVKL
jgi:DNA-binding CsgD family transcriptional regulator